MTVLTEGSRRNAEFIISEAEHYRSRDVGTVAAATATTKLDAGTVLGKLTTGGNLVEYDPAGANGSENIVGVLYEEVTGTAERTYFTRDCQVKDNKLAWKAGISAGQITTATAALEALGIIVRVGA